jgi:hypothetical protein
MRRQSSGQRNTLADNNLNIYKRDAIHQFVNWITNEPHSLTVSVAILSTISPKMTSSYNSKSNHINLKFIKLYRSAPVKNYLQWN